MNDKIIIEKQIGTFNGCNIVLRKETNNEDFEADRMVLEAAETVLNSIVGIGE